MKSPRKQPLGVPNRCCSSGRAALPTALTLLCIILSSSLGAAPTARLQVSTNGAGVVSPNHNGHQLEMGRRYSITATPRPGNLFSNWTGAAGQVLTDRPTLGFTMASNLLLTANFVTNHFNPLRGAYAGLFFPTQETALASLQRISVTNSGSFRLQLVSNGTFSGSVVLGGVLSGFTGKFSLTNQARVSVARPTGKPLALDLSLDLEGRCRGVVRGSAWESPLEAVRLGHDFEVYFNRALGTHTLLIVPQKDSLGGPPGYGALSVKIDPGQAYVTTTSSTSWSDGKTQYYQSETRTVMQPDRVVRAVGTLADAAPVTASSGVDKHGWWPLYAPLYGGRGLVMGWLNAISNDVSHRCVWLRPVAAGGKLFADGFADSRPGLVSRVAPTPAADVAVNWTRASLVIGGGNLPSPLTNEVIMTNHQLRVVSGSLSNTAITLERTKGVFSGSFRHPLTRVLTSFKGALAPRRSITSTAACFACVGSNAVPDLDEWIDDVSGFHAAARTWGAGWFLGPSDGGFVRLEPRFTVDSLEGWHLTLLESNAVAARSFIFDGAAFTELGGASGAGTYLVVGLTSTHVWIEMHRTAPAELAGTMQNLELAHTGPFEGDFQCNGTAPAAGRFLLDRPDHFSPASLDQTALVMTRPDGSRLTNAFGLDTYSRTGSRLAFGDGDYTYSRSGPGTARLSLDGSIFGADTFQSWKTLNYAQAEETQLHFNSPTSGYFASMTAQPHKLPSAAVATGRFLLVRQSDVAPASLAGRNLMLNGSTGARTEFSLGDDDFRIVDSTNTGTYTFKRMSANGAGVSMESTNLYTHVRLKFSSPTNGVFGRIRGTLSAWSFTFENGTFLLK